MTNKNKRERRHFTGQQKTAIVKAHLVDSKSVADLCDQHQIQPTQFFQWQKQLFEQGETASWLRRESGVPASVDKHAKR